VRPITFKSMVYRSRLAGLAKPAVLSICFFFPRCATASKYSPQGLIAGLTVFRGLLPSATACWLLY